MPKINSILKHFNHLSTAIVLLVLFSIPVLGQTLESPVNASHPQSWYKKRSRSALNHKTAKQSSERKNSLYREYFNTEWGMRSAETGLLSKDIEHRLTSIYLEIKTDFPSSEECAHLAYHRHLGNETFFKSFIENTTSLPDQASILIDQINHFELTNKESLKKQSCLKLKSHLSEATLEYSFNVLMSLEPNAILITNGISDTYPIWVLQHVDGIRTDVSVLNIPLLENQTYRQRILSQLNLTPSKFNIKGSELINQIIHKNKAANIYIGLTVPKKVLKDNSKKLVIQGLAYKISPSTSLLEDHWTQFKSDFRSDVSRCFLNSNYIIPLISLHNYYVAIGDAHRQIEIYQELEKITLQLPNGKELLASIKKQH